ncbi:MULTISPECIES: AAA family ATPase [unclassified Meiothermus]|uniref:AAA family ATPase n=1 Tax=unclassified Meiothermus TaxID=370471 RepID=UPI000D7CFD83|nr:MULTISPECIES: AAA family ATPase [unclassified Meiothermus]PZA07240.1 anticodon nuclease [Meiothermus sp. Pnk-1]RYM37974.1 anticodon nuclease [Meiothermus sp. PNK-Is4]
MPAQGHIQTFPDLDALARHLRSLDKKTVLIFAYNGTGKTRLSVHFKELGKVRNDDGEVTSRDTLYFNAFTEDLFTWDNDLENDRERVLRMNTASRFFSGLDELEMENRIRPVLHRYCDFDFSFDYDKSVISFFRDERVPQEDSNYNTIRHDHIKISRGEENIFIWCFFLAVAELAIAGQEAYEWVKYIYIDDPISSLDENNAIAVAAHLAKMLKGQDRVKAIISSHHTLFFNVLCNEMDRAQRYFLRKTESGYELQNTNDTPRFYHVAMLKELRKAAESGQLYTYHFNILRSILEKTATFHGFNHFGDIIKRDPDDEDGQLHARYVNLLSHGNYSLFEPVEMLEENKEIFRKILNDFMNNYRFNPELFPEVAEESIA